MNDGFPYTSMQGWDEALLLLVIKTDISKRTYSQILLRHCSSGLQEAKRRKETVIIA
jgi:hypothetical protein